MVCVRWHILENMSEGGSEAFMDICWIIKAEELNINKRVFPKCQAILQILVQLYFTTNSTY